MKKRIWLWFGAAAIVFAAAVTFLICRLGNFVPGWVDWNRVALTTANGVDAPDEIRLSGKQVRVLQDGETVWQSERDIRVQDLLWCDMDHDGEKELLLLCWRQGRYGDSRPFWITEEEDKRWSQHIFIYDWTGEEIRPIWMASDIGLDAVSWYFDPVQRLVITDCSGEQSAWDWVSWGLQRIELQSADASVLTFGAVGDNLIHRQIYDYAFRHFDGDFSDLFARVQSELDTYDVTSINQETIYVEDPGQYSSYPRFGTPVQVGEAVIEAGFDIVSCATNHTLDMGTDAIDLTVSLYEQAGVVCAGIQSTKDAEYRPYEIYEQNGLRCAVYSYTEMTNGIPVPMETPHVIHTLQDERQVQADLLAGKEAADISLVYVHWGEEYADEPNEQQRHWAQVFADCGVDVVIGTHPHVLQPVEWITGAQGNRTLVYYSLGNFISAQTEEDCRQGGLAYFTVIKTGNRCSVSDYGLKSLLTEEENGHYTTGMQ